MSGNAQHTPGPWKAEYDDEDGSHLIRMGSALRNRAMHQVQHRIEYDHGLYEDEGKQFDEAAANARLIAAAPDLLDALEALVTDANRLCDRQHGGTYEDDCRASLAFARDAIRKARGN